jgi:hypothetical protein
LAEKHTVRKNPFPLLFLILFLLPFFGERLLSAGERSFMVIELWGRNGGEETVRFRVEEAAILCLSYIHSLYHTPQEEVYTIQGESLILREMHFGNLEAAGYYDPNPAGDLYREGNLWKVKMLPPLSFPVVRMRVPFTGPLLLLIDGHTAWTSRQKDQGSLLIVKIVHEDSRGERREKGRQEDQIVQGKRIHQRKRAEGIPRLIEQNAPANGLGQ